MGFGEVVDSKFEADKNKMLEAESEFNEGIFFGYAWMSTEYRIGTNDAVYQCRTVIRRSDDIAFDAAFIDSFGVRFEDYSLKGAKMTMHVSFPKALGGDGPAQIPTRGPRFCPRRVDLMPGDVSKHGFTQGCPGYIA